MIYDAETEALARRQAELARPMSSWEDLSEEERERFRREAFWRQILIERGMARTKAAIEALL